jgi:hypothetical protein
LPSAPGDATKAFMLQFSMFQSSTRKPTFIVTWN